MHSEWPALTFKSPFAYDELTLQEKENIAEITSDTCIIHYPDQTDRFIRCILHQKITDSCDTLQYGVWVSLSQKNFEDYVVNYDSDYVVQYFGWLSNNIPQYVFENSIPTTVLTSIGGNRPEIFPHKDFDHPFVHDYYHGISMEEAEKRINEMLGVGTKKPWWNLW
jgi:hypothetical protein